MTARQEIRRVRRIARALAYAFLAGDWSMEGLTSRGEEAVGKALPKLLVRLALRLFTTAPAGRERQLEALLLRSRTFLKAAHPSSTSAGEANRGLRVERWFVPASGKALPVAALAHLALPDLATAFDVAQLTGLPVERLGWFCDRMRLNRRAHAPALEHYLYRWMRKASGAYRLIEQPKWQLKRAQRAILTRILNELPLHECCHGHRAQHSVLTFVQPHVGQSVVVALDLAEFFSCIHEARVRAMFAACGYSDEIASLLASLCCAPTPHRILRQQPVPPEPTSRELQERFWQRRRLTTSHLPQGAPTSPMLANLAAFKLDLRLDALAQRYGARYTRYADDLAFSGDARLASALPRFLPVVGAIALEEGFAVRFNKTRVMHAHQRQQLCGVVINQRPAMQRKELEALEAILVNCQRFGVETQNREQRPAFRDYLAGRVAWVEQVHPRKGARLRSLLEQLA